MSRGDPNVTMSSRLAGAIWGHLVGDAMGVPYEFRPHISIEDVRWGASGTHQQPPGTWSDDGGLMLALLDSLVSVGFNVQDQAARALAWMDGPDYKPGRVFDIGGTTARALGRLAAGISASESGARAESDNGNGSLMRILPVALVGRRLTDQELVGWSCQASRVTHAHPRAQAVCAVYCLIARTLLVASPIDPHDLLVRAFEVADRWLDGSNREELRIVRSYSKRTGSGYVVDTFWSAWEAFAGAADYPNAIATAIAFGNDTDTTACVAGGLAGARWGLEAIPSEWRLGMRGQVIADDLTARLLATMTADES